MPERAARLRLRAISTVEYLTDEETAQGFAFGAGFLPGGTGYERFAGLKAGPPSFRRAFAALPGKLNGFLAAAADSARSRAAGQPVMLPGPGFPARWIRRQMHYGGRVPAPTGYPLGQRGAFPCCVTRLP
jgi:hypothetical protein